MPLVRPGLGGGWKIPVLIFGCLQWSARSCAPKGLQQPGNAAWAGSGCRNGRGQEPRPQLLAAAPPCPWAPPRPSAGSEPRPCPVAMSRGRLLGPCSAPHPCAPYPAGTPGPPARVWAGRGQSVAAPCPPGSASGARVSAASRGMSDIGLARSALSVAEQRSGVLSRDGWEERSPLQPFQKAVNWKKSPFLCIDTNLFRGCA